MNYYYKLKIGQKGFCLYYFESKKSSAKPLGMVILPSYSIQALSESESGKPFSVVLAHISARSYVFAFENEVQQNNWILKLSNATMVQN